MTLDEIVGGAPYGATTIAGARGQRQPTKLELDDARHQRDLIAKAAAKCRPGLQRSCNGEFRLKG
jgi:NAD(P)H dehydrogenase (quinone)